MSAAVVGSAATHIGGTGLDGTPHKLDDLRAPVRLLYFFRAYPKCIEELKVLERAQDEALGEMQVLALCTDKTDEKALREISPRVDSAFPVVFADTDESRPYLESAIPYPPALFVIGDSTIIAARYGLAPELEKYLQEEVYGSIDVTSEPAECQVELDQKRLPDVTPSRIEKVLIGSHKLVLSAKGYESAELTDIAVKAGKTTAVHDVKLRPLSVSPPPDADIVAPCSWEGVIPAAAQGLTTSLIRPPHARRLPPGTQDTVTVTSVNGDRWKLVAGPPSEGEFALTTDGVFEFPASAAGAKVTFSFPCSLVRAALLVSGNMTYYDSGGGELAAAVDAEFTANKYQRLMAGDSAQAELVKVEPRPGSGRLFSGRVKTALESLHVEELVRVICTRQQGVLEMQAEVYGAEGRLWTSDPLREGKAVRVPASALSGPGGTAQLRSAVRVLFGPWFLR